MEYTYNILDEVYNWMVSRKKDIEVRLLKEKSMSIQIGDYITFNNQEYTNKYVRVKVIDKIIFDNVDELLNKYDVKRMMPEHNEEEFRELLKNIYGDSLINGKLVAFSFKYLESDND